MEKERKRKRDKEGGREGGILKLKSLPSASQLLGSRS